jgi:hypothetical protein
MNTRITLITTLLSATLAGCAPSLVSHLALEPASGDIAQLDGRAVTKAQRDSVVVVASFEREELDYVALDVEIKNRTTVPLDVNPADFRLVALGTAQDTLSDPTNSALPYLRNAANPGYEAGRVELNQKREVKRLKTAKIINTVLLVAAVASDISSSSNNRSFGEWRSNRISHDAAYQLINVKRAVDHGTFANRMQRYDYEAYRWRELALKATTIAPGESVRGLVFLPKIPQAQYIGLTYAAPEQEGVSLLFRQIQTVTGGRKNRRK